MANDTWHELAAVQSAGHSRNKRLTISLISRIVLELRDQWNRLTICEAMIQCEDDYQQAVCQLKAEEERLRTTQLELQTLNLSEEEIKRVLDPMRSFHEQLKEEVESYEKLKRGEFDEIRNFEGMGRLLVALRIAQGLSQRELAERLNLHESQVSRDERNEYHGISVDRIKRILDALGAEIRTSVVTFGESVATGREPVST